ncbi:MAG: outer membrane protein transport protein [Pirellulales bacterium]|nr:outer membrane protein transport protein [Pirellulales bacterium]
MWRKRMPQFSLAAWLLIASMTYADGVVLNGTSPRSIGRGGTDIAHADTAGILLDNPAGAVNIQGDRLFEVGVNMMFTDFGYADPLRYGNSSEFTPLPEVGFIRKSTNGNWAYGLGVFAPAGFSERYSLEGPVPFVGPQKYMSFGSLGKILPALAYRVNDKLSVGGTLGVAISHDELEGPYTLQGPGVFRGTPTLLDLQATGAALCWSLGMQYKMSDATSLGLTYQSESRLQCNGPTTVTVPGMGTSGYDTQLDITWPQSVGVGLRHEICPHRIFSVDVIWYNWANAFDELSIALTDPTTPGFPPIVESFPLRWRDTVSTRLGYEWTLDNGHVVRCGYVYHRNPIPNGTLTPFIQATVEHSFSLGYGLNWRGWDLDLGYMLGFAPDRYVAVSDLAGNEFGQSTQSAKVHCAAFSFTKRY